MRCRSNAREKCFRDFVVARIVDRGERQMFTHPQWCMHIACRCAQSRVWYEWNLESCSTWLVARLALPLR